MKRIIVVFVLEEFFFDFTKDKKITSNQYVQFEKFYQNFNDIIRKMTCYFPNFYVGWEYHDDNGKECFRKSEDLTELYEFLATRVDYNLDDADENEIYLSGEFVGMTNNCNVSSVKK